MEQTLLEPLNRKDVPTFLQYKIQYEWVHNDFCRATRALGVLYSTPSTRSTVRTVQKSEYSLPPYDSYGKFSWIIRCYELLEYASIACSIETNMRPMERCGNLQIVCSIEILW